MSTIFISGVYGVEKNTIYEEITKNIGIPFYSAGDLISEMNGEKYGDNKGVANKEKNQDILANSVSQILKKYSSILLAGHF